MGKGKVGRWGRDSGPREFVGSGGRPCGCLGCPKGGWSTSTPGLMHRVTGLWGLLSWCQLVSAQPGSVPLRVFGDVVLDWGPSSVGGTRDWKAEPPLSGISSTTETQCGGGHL